MVSNDNENHETPSEETVALCCEEEPEKNCQENTKQKKTNTVHTEEKLSKKFEEESNKSHLDHDQNEKKKQEGNRQKEEDNLFHPGPSHQTPEQCVTEGEELTQENEPTQDEDLFEKEGHFQEEDLTQQELTNEEELNQEEELTQEEKLTNEDLTKEVELTKTEDVTKADELTKEEDLTKKVDVTKEEELMASPESSLNSTDSAAQVDYVRDSEDSAQMEDTEDSAQMEDTEDSAQMEDTDDSAQMEEDTEDSGDYGKGESSEINDGANSSQVEDDAEDSAQMEDTEDFTHVEDHKKISAEVDDIEDSGVDDLLHSAIANSSQAERLRALTLLLPESPHVSPMLQRPLSFTLVPRVAVPLHTAPYDSALDAHAALTASFTRFPYPTYAELSSLTASTKIPETTIRAWFSAQRLKRGITWSPEEVEEARKKMFNGSVPAMTVTIATTASSASDVVRRSVTMSSAGSPPNLLKRSVTTTTAFGPEAKRPVMAVAPKLMVPPPLMAPPTQLQKPLEARRANGNINESRRAALPLQQPQRNKVSPLVSIPSMVFPESLTRPTIAPPPIYAPPFKSDILVPRRHEATPICLPNGARTTSAPPIPPQRRPVIQSLRGTIPNLPSTVPNLPSSICNLSNTIPNLASTIPNLPNTVPNMPSTIANLLNTIPNMSALDSQRELNECEGKKGYNGKWVEPLDGKWLESPDEQSDVQQRAQVLTQFPLLERLKGKSSEQLKLLEESFLKNSFPTQAEVQALASSAQLSSHEVDSWFSERRALRDNLEQALINSMGTKREAKANANSQIPNTNPNQLQMNSLENKHNANANSNTHFYAANQNVDFFTSMSSRPPVLSVYSVPNGHRPLPLSPVPHPHSPGEEPNKNNGHKTPTHSVLPLRETAAWPWFDSQTGSAALPGSDLIGPRSTDLTNGSSGEGQEAELNWFNKTLSYSRPDFSFGRWMDRRPDLSES